MKTVRGILLALSALLMAAGASLVAVAASAAPVPENGTNGLLTLDADPYPAQNITIARGDRVLWPVTAELDSATTGQLSVRVISEQPLAEDADALRFELASCDQAWALPVMPTDPATCAGGAGTVVISEAAFASTDADEVWSLGAIAPGIPRYFLGDPVAAALDPGSARRRAGPGVVRFHRARPHPTLRVSPRPGAPTPDRRCSHSACCSAARRLRRRAAARRSDRAGVVVRRGIATSRGRRHGGSDRGHLGSGVGGILGRSGVGDGTGRGGRLRRARDGQRHRMGADAGGQGRHAGTRSGRRDRRHQRVERRAGDEQHGDVGGNGHEPRQRRLDLVARPRGARRREPRCRRLPSVGHQRGGLYAIRPGDECGGVGGGVRRDHLQRKWCRVSRQSVVSHPAHGNDPTLHSS